MSNKIGPNERKALRKAREDLRRYRDCYDVMPLDLARRLDELEEMNLDEPVSPPTK